MMCRSRTTIAIAAALITCAMAASAQSGSSPPEYGYGTIPFGATAREVLRELSGTKVDADDGGEAQFVGHYEVLSDYFTEGLYPNLLGVKQLNVAVTRMYRVSHESWENVVAMELYFFRDHEAPDDPASYRLFLVRKTLRTAGAGSHTTVAEGLQETITGALGIEPVSHDVKYQPFGQLFALAARISLWEAPSTDIFVLVYQNILSSSNANIVYRDRALWLEYVDAARTQDAAGKETDQEKARSVGSSF